jgi:SagB-type dehydrogenase family enzyme
MGLSMSKLAWVLLPLAGVVGWLAWLALRQRLPPRVALNVWFSVLLLVYLLTTAGLGIFWVANQHLPVFDWHYLFGYATVLLVVVHLAFNFRVVWRHFTQPRPVAAQRAVEATRRSTVGGLTAVGVAAAAGVGYFVGLRHGRTELTVASGSGLPALGDVAWSVVERFHAFSAHTRGGVLRRAAGASWGDAPLPFKRYANVTEIVLPAPQAASPNTALNAATLGTVLWHTSGVSQRRGPVAFRTSPSSGALFSTELYVAVRGIDGVPIGGWHYDAEWHRLARVGDPPWPKELLMDGGQASTVLLMATAVFARSGHKYRDRTYRYVLADLGHALENLRVAALALGCQTTWLRAFDEAALASAWGLNQDEEGVLAVAALHAPGRVQRPATLLAAPRWQAAPVAADASSPVSLTQAVHHATSLRPAPQEVVARHAATVLSAAERADDGLALPAPLALNSNVLGVIAQRRSQRRFAATPLTLAVLATALHAMARAHAPVFSDAVRVDVVTPAVQGLPPASWRYDPQRHALQRRAVHDGDTAALRQQSRRAALDQDVIGAAAAVLVLSIDRAVLQVDAAGAARGYRHAFLEVGLQGERLYLAAGALGLGVCAVGAFYDDEASALVGVDPQREWVVHFAALGVPA